MQRYRRRVRPARLEHRFVWIRSADDLDDVEALRGAIGAEFAEALHVDPLAEPLPPGVAEPEEGRAVGVLEMAAIGRDAHGAAADERVRALRRRDDNRA